MATEHITSRSEQDTSAAGRTLAARLGPGSVVLLFGDLGAGKTAFVRGIAEGLALNPKDVSSPTFTIMQEYRGGPCVLFHVDLYRLNGAREIEDLGMEELTEDGVLAIEWAERMPDAPPGAVRVTLSHAGDTERHIEIAS